MIQHPLPSKAQPNRRRLYITGAMLVMSAVMIFYLNTRSHIPSASLQPGTNVQDQLLTSNNIRVVFDPAYQPPDIPKSLPAFTYTRTQLDLEPMASALALHYNLTKSSTVGGLWSNKSGGTYILINTLNKYLDFTTSYQDRPDLYTGDSPPTHQSAVAATLKIVTDFPDIPEVAAAPQSRSLIMEGASTNALETGFTTSVSGISIFDPKYYLSYPVTSIVGQKNTLLSLKVFQDIVVAKDKQSTYSLLQNDQILSQIRSGKISALDNYPDLITDPKNVDRISIKSIQVIYYPDETLSLLMPSFKISADIYSKNGQVNQSYILLPAVSSSSK